MVTPSHKQFQDYRSKRRDTVRRIVDFYHAEWNRGVKPTDWALDVIRRARDEHSSSIGRFNALVIRG